jgi:hypothetical protein
VVNFCEYESKWEGHQIIVTTIEELLESVESSKDEIDLSFLRMVIIDEAEVFFKDDSNLR